ncbi:MAG: TonB-dependent receptor [Bacteroidetes bacterium]|nr:TonB-dependent receptor [Bacteroidota bacterium]
MKKIIFITIILSIAFMPLKAQVLKQDTISKTVQLDEVVISANKVEENKRYVAQQVQTIPIRQIKYLNLQSTAELIQNSGTVTMQKSQQGGGSPVIRGFEASRVLLMIDGVRMNNLIYRIGHLQNVITADQNTFERVEILFGPSSTVYGSDALGGVIHFFTKDPLLAGESQKLNFTGNAFARYGTANNEMTGHLDLNFGTRKFGSLTSFTYSDFGDLLMGGNPNPFYNTFGQRIHYAERIDGKDSLVANNNILLQRQSAYSQYDLLQKFLYQPNQDISHLINIQLSNSSDIPRYDRLTDPKGEGLKYAEWFYGPQFRLLTAYDMNVSNRLEFNNIHLNISYQNIEESRHTRNFGKDNLTHRHEKVQVAGFNLDLTKNIRTNSIRFGIDGQYNTLKSTAFEEDIVSGETSPLDTRYPDGDNRMTLVGAYGTHTWQINDKFVLNDGIRVGYATLFSTFVDKTFFTFPFNEVNQNNLTYSGSLGLIFLPTQSWKFSVNGSTGFRVPNVDDLSKVFESTPGNVTVPNPDLKPEKTVNGDLNITRWCDEMFSWENVFYGTYFFDVIVKDTFLFDGQDSIMYDGTMSRVMANQNKENAFILGYSTTLKADLTDNFGLTASLNYTYGRIIGDSTNTPLDHIPPIFGRIGMTYKCCGFTSELFTNFNGWKRLKDYYLNGEDNEAYATPDGMPAWYTLNARVSYQASKYILLQAGVDNIFDIQYRTFASGINAPGRNLFVTVRVSF